MDIVDPKKLEFQLTELGRKLSSGISGEEYKETRRKHAELKRKLEFYNSKLEDSNATVFETIVALNNIACLSYGLFEEYRQAVEALEKAKLSTHAFVENLNNIVLSTEATLQVIERALTMPDSKSLEDEESPIIKRLQELSKKRRRY